MSNLISISDIAQMGKAVAASNFFGLKKPDEFIALALVAQAEGRHPAIVARDYHIVSGKPTLKADAILARFQEAGGRVEWTQYTDTICEAVFSHPAGGSVRIDWTMQRAQAAGVTGNPTWKKYPRAMLRARCISEGVRTVYPAVLCGVYTPEEQEDIAYERMAGTTAPVAPIDQTIPVVQDAEVVKSANERLKDAIRSMPNAKEVATGICTHYGVHIISVLTEEQSESALAELLDREADEQMRRASDSDNAE